MTRPLAYITSSWSDDEYEAKSMAMFYCRQVYEAGFSPICPRIMHDMLLKDEIPKEHKDRLDMASELLRRSRIVIVCGPTINWQVKNDIALARRHHIAATTLDAILTVENAAVKKN